MNKSILNFQHINHFYSIWSVLAHLYRADQHNQDSIDQKNSKHYHTLKTEGLAFLLNVKDIPS